MRIFKTCKCGAKISFNKEKCESCKSKEKAKTAKLYDSFYRDESDFYNSIEWRRLRVVVLKEEPFCRICKKPTKIIDHIKPIKQGGARLDRSNLQGLCSTCHNIKTAKE